MSMRRRALGLLSAVSLTVSLGALSACSAEDARDASNDAREAVESAAESLPEVNWDKVGRDLQREIDQAVDAGDCQALKDELSQQERNDTEVTDYIKAQIERLDC